jgi:hypothetical protein
LTPQVIELAGVGSVSLGFWAVNALFRQIFRTGEV